jgi:hypothetical protein
MKKLKLIKKITTLSLINIGTLISLPLIASSCSHSQEEAEQITIRGSHNLNIRDGSDGTTNYFFNDNKNKLMTIS